MATFFEDFVAHSNTNLQKPFYNTKNAIGSGYSAYVSASTGLGAILLKETVKSSAIGKITFLVRQGEDVAVSVAVGATTVDWGGFAGVAGGVAAGFVVGTLLGPTIVGVTVGVAAGYVGAALGEALYQTVVEHYPNAVDDIYEFAANFGAELRDAIMEAAARDSSRDFLRTIESRWNSENRTDDVESSAASKKAEADAKKNDPDNSDATVLDTIQVVARTPTPGAIRTGDRYIADPVVLDLSGDGINITQLGSSNVYMHMQGDALQHKTAWAGAGNGVLVLDQSGAGDVGSPEAFIFTSWDPTATSNTEALANVFDTNSNGKLDAGDARWSEFKILVTNSDGTRQLQTFDQLGIISIDLMIDNNRSVLADGTVVLGHGGYTRADGSQGTIADVQLSYDEKGYLVEQETVVNADGSTSMSTVAFHADGRIAYKSTLTISPDATIRTSLNDVGGDGVVDSIQIHAVVTESDGKRTTTISNYASDGTLSSRETTSITADMTKTTVLRDIDGNGLADEIETREVGSGNDTTVIIRYLNEDGSEKESLSVFTSFDGTISHVSTDTDGDGNSDVIESRNITLNSDGTKTEDVLETSRDGTLLQRIFTTTSADGRSKEISVDLDGDGVFDLAQRLTIVPGSGGGSVTTRDDFNGDGSLRGRVVTEISDDGLTKTVKTDVNGDGIFDLTTEEFTHLQVDGSRVKTVVESNADSSLKAKSISIWSADGKSRSETYDIDGDGGADYAESLSVLPSGSTEHIANTFNPDGSLQNRTTTITSEDGLTTTIIYSTNSSGFPDRIEVRQTVKGADESSAISMTDYNGTGILLAKTIVTTSADGQESIVQVFDAVSGEIVRTKTQVAATNIDGSQTQTTFEYHPDGTLRAKVTSTVSADRKSTTTEFDTDGDGQVERIVEQSTGSDGNVVETLTNLLPDGELRDRTITIRSSNELSVRIKKDMDGDGVYDETQTTETVLNADGSRTSTVTEWHPNGVASAILVTTTSANGLVRIVEYDRDGDGAVDEKITDSTILNTNGSRSQTVTYWNGDGTIKQQSVTTVDASGLSKTTTVDATGLGNIDSSQTDATIYNADGSTTRTITTYHPDGSLKEQIVANTYVNGDDVATYDYDGDGNLDQRSSRQTLSSGEKVTTVVDFHNDGSVRGKVVSVTSSDNRLITIERDSDGDGNVNLVDELNVVSNFDGSTTETRSRFDGNENLLERIVTTKSLDAKTIETHWDTNGDGTFDLSQIIAINANTHGERTETYSVFDSAGHLQRQVVTTVSSNGHTTSVATDDDGDGQLDQLVMTAKDASGNVVVTASDFDTLGVIERSLVTTTSGNGLSVSKQWDIDGDGVVDQTRNSVTTLRADGGRTETTSNFSPDGILTDQTTVTTSGDGMTATYRWDHNGDGVFDQSKIETSSIGSDGTSTKLTSYFKAGGLLGSRYEETSSSHGQTIAQRWDKDGDGIYEETSFVEIALNSDGSFTQSLEGNNPYNVVITTSPDGLTQTTTTVTFEETLRQETVFTLKNADGSKLEVTEDQFFKSVTTVSADERTTGLIRYNLGTGTVSQKADTKISADGTKTVVVDNFNHLGILTDRETSVSSNDGLLTTHYIDLNGDGVTDIVKQDASVFRADGSVIRTMTATDIDGSLREKTVTTISADGRVSVLQLDSAGIGHFDHVETTTYDASGASETLVETISRDGSVLHSWKRLVSTDGNVTTVAPVGNAPGGLVSVDHQVKSINGNVTRVVDIYDPNFLYYPQYNYTITTKDGKERVTYTEINSLVALTNGLYRSDRILTEYEVYTVNEDGSVYIKTAGWTEDNVQIYEKYQWLSQSGVSNIALLSDEAGVHIRVDGDYNSFAVTKEILPSIALYDGSGTQLTTGIPDIGTVTISVTGKFSNLWVSNGTLLVAENASANIMGASNIVIANTGANVAFVGTDNRIFRTKADISGVRDINLRHGEDVRSEHQYGFSYIASDKSEKFYYEADKIPVSFFNWQILMLVEGAVTHVFLNGGPPANYFEFEYKLVSINDSREYVSGYPALSLVADGYVGFDGGLTNKTDGVTINGNWVTAVGDRAVAITGSNYAQARDYLIGGNGNDVIDGRAGNSDILHGGAGDDTIYFDAASYGKLVPGSSGQAVDGGSGYDTGIITSTGDVNISLAVGNFEALISNRGSDTIVGNPNAAGYLDGGAGNDIVYGGLLNDIILGGTGNDVLYGGGGDDLLIGGAGDDILYGQEGDDILIGSEGNDILNGAAGNDIFLFNVGFGHDKIQDFENGIDLIEFEDGLFTSWEDLAVKMSQVGADTKISYDGENSIVLQNVNWTQLSADDFRFS